MLPLHRRANWPETRSFTPGSIRYFYLYGRSRLDFLARVLISVTSTLVAGSATVRRSTFAHLKG